MPEERQIHHTNARAGGDGWRKHDADDADDVRWGAAQAQRRYSRVAGELRLTRLDSSKQRRVGRVFAPGPFSFVVLGRRC